MAEVIRMPRMSDTMEEGNIIEWHKAEGDKVEPGETLAEVETDKATMELDAYVEGVLLHIAVKEGPVPINGVIAVIGQEGEDWKKAIEQADQENGQGGAAETSATAEAPTVEAEAAPATVTGSGDADKRVKASPLARSIAREAGIDLAGLAGSGDGGRIVRRDVEAALDRGETAAPAPKASPASTPPPAAPPKEEKRAAAPAAPVTPFSIGGGEANYEEVTISQMRKTIARRLSESKFSAPHFYLTMEINMGKAIKWREQINQVAPNKISFNDLILKACAASLRLHPNVNSSWLGDKIRRNKDVHIGVAVAIDEGLLVPVIRYADMKSLSQINAEVRQLAARAKDRKLAPEEMQGNTFTISNLGMYGIEEFTAIINPPDA